MVVATLELRDYATFLLWIRDSWESVTPLNWKKEHAARRLPLPEAWQCLPIELEVRNSVEDAATATMVAILCCVDFPWAVMKSIV